MMELHGVYDLLQPYSRRQSIYFGFTFQTKGYPRTGVAWVVHSVLGCIRNGLSMKLSEHYLFESERASGVKPFSDPVNHWKQIINLSISHKVVIDLSYYHHVFNLCLIILSNRLSSSLLNPFRKEATRTDRHSISCTAVINHRGHAQTLLLLLHSIIELNSLYWLAERHYVNSHICQCSVIL